MGLLHVRVRQIRRIRKYSLQKVIVLWRPVAPLAFHFEYEEEMSREPSDSLGQDLVDALVVRRFALWE